MLAMIFAQLDQASEARAEVAEVLRLDSTFTISETAKSLAAFNTQRTMSIFWCVASSRLPLAVVVEVAKPTLAASRRYCLGRR